MIVFIMHALTYILLLNCNIKLGCIHLNQNKVPDYFHHLSGKINNTKPAYIFCCIMHF